MVPHGYAGKILGVDLSNKTFSDESLGEEVLRKYIGGAGLGARYLYDENPDNVEWSNPENRMIFANGPLSGTVAPGSGSVCVVSKGPMTNLAGCSQANGFGGAFLKSCGYDGIVIRGCADEWSYLFINGEKTEFRNASHLLGKDTRETQELILKELGLNKGKASVFCVGPAAENRVRFSVIVGDGSHVVSKNGLGAVMASKKLKGIAIARGRFKPLVRDEELLKTIAKELRERAISYNNGSRHKWGTNGGFSALYKIGQIPVKNYTTNLFPEHETMNGQYVRTHFETVERELCFNCGIHHNIVMRVTEGPYTGFIGEDPEYEAYAGLGPQIGNTDAGGVFVLNDLVDRLGVDHNEAGWVIGWLMECYEKGLITKGDTDGIEMNWGNVESAKKILLKISSREGIGNLLAEGVMRASREVGGEAADMAIFTLKGTTPRGHDHRARWSQLIDNCFTNTSTIEATFANPMPHELDMSPVRDPFSPWEVAAINASVNGWHIFEDCLGVCRFNTVVPKLVVEAYNAATDYNLSLPDAIKTGKRIVNTFRVYNLKNGLTSDVEIPSTRYGSTPVDGPAAGLGIMKHWEVIRKIYFQLMGWNANTGAPLPSTLRDLELEELVSDIEKPRSTRGNDIK